MAYKISYLYMVILTIMPLSPAVSQIKGDQVWIGGYDSYGVGPSGRNLHVMDFRGNTMHIEGVRGDMGTLGNNASICDENGSLLFFSNGRAVMDANLSIIANGTDINDGEWTRRYWPDPGYGFPGFQDIMILPDPNSPSGFYLIHKTPVYNPPAKDSFEIRYSYIDYNMSNNTSKVTIKTKSFIKKTIFF
jgi:hypothetical protein